MSRKNICHHGRLERDLEQTLILHRHVNAIWTDGVWLPDSNNEAEQREVEAEPTARGGIEGSSC